MVLFLISLTIIVALLVEKSNKNWLLKLFAGFALITLSFNAVDIGRDGQQPKIENLQHELEYYRGRIALVIEHRIQTDPWYLESIQTHHIHLGHTYKVTNIDNEYEFFFRTSLVYENIVVGYVDVKEDRVGKLDVVRMNYVQEPDQDFDTALRKLRPETLEMTRDDIIFKARKLMGDAYLPFDELPTLCYEKSENRVGWLVRLENNKVITSVIVTPNFAYQVK